MEIKQVLKILDDYNYTKGFESEYSYIFYKKFGFNCKISVDISLFSNTLFFRFDTIENGCINNIVMGKKFDFDKFQPFQLESLLNSVNKFVFEYNKIFGIKE